MIRGRFESHTRRPVIDCFIHIPSLNAEAVIPFVMDTGADCTVLMPGDAERFNIDFSQLPVTRSVTGVGGECQERMAHTSLLVSSDTTVYGYRFAMGIAEFSPSLEGVPSLLGMDIMRFWKIYFDYPNKRLEIEIQMCDEERSL
jgi:hypothetical protein